MSVVLPYQDSVQIKISGLKSFTSTMMVAIAIPAAMEDLENGFALDKISDMN